MKNRKNWIITVLALLLCVSLGGNVYLYTHRQTVVQYTVEQEPYTHQYDETVPYSGEGESKGELRVLYVGNSITQHATCDYWWGDWGMAASSREMDYVHQLAQMLSQEYDVSFSLSQLSQWEIMGHDRHEGLQLLDSEMKNEYDLVVIQLGENVPAGDATIQTDFADLVEYIQSLQDVKIYVVGNFWPDEGTDAAKQASCDGESVFWVSLDGLNTSEYKAGMGTMVEGLDGTQHAIEHQGVSIHPGDAGMTAIAQRLYDAIQAG